jgi:hypothetical protein
MISRALVCIAGFALAFASTQTASARPTAAIAVSYKAIPLSSANLQQNRVGKLVYRGGLQLSSPDPRFGGWSGLVISKDGKRMLSQSDEAHWLRADLRYDHHGNLTGIANAELADMKALDGHVMRGKEGDAEGLTAVSPAGPDGPVLVSFERKARVWRYDLSKNLDAVPTKVPMPEDIKTLKSNSGLEGIAMLTPHAFLAVAEDSNNAQGDRKAWLVPSGVPAKGIDYGVLGVIPHAPYEISDAAFGPDRRYLYLLERHYFGPLRGVVIAVRRIDAGTIKAGARLQGQELAAFTMHENIDNMEGLALHRGPHGETLLTMISDDNYNPIQRTLLLMFEVTDKAQ